MKLLTGWLSLECHLIRSSIPCISCKLLIRSSCLAQFTFNCLAKILHRQFRVEAPLLKSTFFQKTKSQAQLAKLRTELGQEPAWSSDSRPLPRNSTPELESGLFSLEWKDGLALKSSSSSSTSICDRSQEEQWGSSNLSSAYGNILILNRWWREGASQGWVGLRTFCSCQRTRGT